MRSPVMVEVEERRSAVSKTLGASKRRCHCDLLPSDAGGGMLSLERIRKSSSSSSSLTPPATLSSCNSASSSRLSVLARSSFEGASLEGTAPAAEPGVDANARNTSRPSPSSSPSPSPSPPPVPIAGGASGLKLGSARSSAAPTGGAKRTEDSLTGLGPSPGCASLAPSPHALRSDEAIMPRSEHA